MSKGIELPGREGRWEEASTGCLSMHDDQVWVKLRDYRPGERDFVIMRKVAEGDNAMPMLNVFDVVEVLGGKRLVVINTRPVHFLSSRSEVVFLSAQEIMEITEVWRHGKCIWQRGCW